MCVCVLFISAVAVNCIKDFLDDKSLNNPQLTAILEQLM